MHSRTWSDSPVLRLLAAALLLAGAAIPVAAQSTLATITGMVSDPTGAALPGARIEATHIATNYVFRAVANEAGVYTLAQIRDGEYSLRVTAAGFKETTMRGVGLGNRDVRRIDFRLEVGAVETRVEVTAQAAAIETESARISNTKGEGRISDTRLFDRIVQRSLGFMFFFSSSR
jgi:hypothetical protein